MMMVRCRLAPSATDGLGVFTEVDIRQGELVWLFDPRYDICFFREDRPGMPARFRDLLDHYGYEHPTDVEMLVLDCDEGRFLAPSASPNIVMDNPVRGVAQHAIRAGEELTRGWRASGPVKSGTRIHCGKAALVAAQ